MPFDETRFLKTSVEVLGFFNEEQLRRITPDIERHSYRAGQVLLLRGEVSSGFYIIKQGKAVASYKDKSGAQARLELGVGDFFGEISLLEDGVSDASIKAAEDDTIVMTIPSASFNKLLEIQPLLKKSLLDKVAQRRKSFGAR